MNQKILKLPDNFSSNRIISEICLRNGQIKLYQSNFGGKPGSNPNHIPMKQTGLLRSVGKPYSKLKMATPPPIDMDGETESQAYLETLEPQLPKEKKLVAGAAKYCTTFKSNIGWVYYI